jgi:hypothetical protein
MRLGVRDGAQSVLGRREGAFELTVIGDRSVDGTRARCAALPLGQANDLWMRMHPLLRHCLAPPWPMPREAVAR